ncbi:MAG: hypothetical protein R3B08_02870 [Nitrospira sp.]
MNRRTSPVGSRAPAIYRCIGLDVGRDERHCGLVLVNALAMAVRV